MLSAVIYFRSIFYLFVRDFLFFRFLVVLNYIAVNDNVFDDDDDDDDFLNRTHGCRLLLFSWISVIFSR